jgi:hypothetical protein
MADPGYSDTGWRLKLLSEIPDWDHGRALLEEVKKRLDKQREKFENSKKIGTENVESQPLYHLGRVTAFKEIIDLPDWARKDIEKGDNIK